MIAGVLRMLLGLGGMLFALGVIVLAVRISGGTMGLRCGLVKFRRFVVCVFHVIFSLLAEEYRHSNSNLNSGRTECQRCS